MALYKIQYKDKDGKIVDLPISSNNENGVYFVDGSSSTTAGTWIGSNPNITEYYDGLVINYKVGVAGASTTKLNINGLGAKTCYLRGDSKITTHYAVGTMVLLSYNATTGAFYSADYDANTNTYVTQAYRSTSEYRPLLLSAKYTKDNTSGSSASSSYWTNKIYANPNTGDLYGTTLYENGTSLSEKYQAKGDYANLVHSHTIDDINGLSDAITSIGNTAQGAEAKVNQTNELVNDMNADIAELYNLISTLEARVLALESGSSSDSDWTKLEGSQTANSNIQLYLKIESISTDESIQIADGALPIYVYCEYEGSYLVCTADGGGDAFASFTDDNLVEDNIYTFNTLSVMNGATFTPITTNRAYLVQRNN